MGKVITGGGEDVTKKVGETLTLTLNINGFLLPAFKITVNSVTEEGVKLNVAKLKYSQE